MRPEDVDEAAALLAARHRRDRQRLPVLARALEGAPGCRKVVEGQLKAPFAAAVVAHRSGKAAGFMVGQTMTLSPDHFASQFIPPHSAQVGVEGHAVAAGEDVTAVYRAMYAELAGRWVKSGFFVHRAHIVPGDLEAQEAWVSLGFGRHLTAAVRLTATPAPQTREADVEIHRAGAEDIDVVMQLADTLALHHTLSPMFWPYLHTTDAAARAVNLAALEANEIPYFIGYQGGRPAGAQTFLKPGFTPSIVEQEGNVYLFEGIVNPDVRSGGVGTALLAHSMAWARDHGFETCGLHFASGNFSGAPFWLGHGFVPVEYTMERRVDERIAWANR